jgi:hypothetical protein
MLAVASWSPPPIVLSVPSSANGGRTRRDLPVRAGNLDGFVLRRALRGGPLPDTEVYIEITGEMLDAVDEAGPLAPKPYEKGGRR